MGSFALRKTTFEHDFSIIRGASESAAEILPKRLIRQAGLLVNTCQLGYDPSLKKGNTPETP